MVQPFAGSEAILVELIKRQNDPAICWDARLMGRRPSAKVAVLFDSVHALVTLLEINTLA